MDDFIDRLMDIVGYIGCLSVLVCLIVGLAGLLFAWMTHIFFCYSTEAWGFLIGGAFFIPIGIVHGVWLWFT